MLILLRWSPRRIKSEIQNRIGQRSKKNITSSLYVCMVKQCFRALKAEDELSLQIGRFVINFIYCHKKQIL